MSVREDERQKNNCPSRGLGIAAAAIGVGVGAALYYFFNKKSENPDSEGSTSANWTCEEPQQFSQSTMADNRYAGNSSFEEDEYATISEHSTTDTSIISSGSGLSSNVPSDSSSSTSMSSIDSDESMDSDFEDACYLQTSQDSVQIISSDSEWDATIDSLDVPSDTMQRSPVHRFLDRVVNLLSPASDYSRPHNRGQEQIRKIRGEQFRQRSWSLEECSICCEVMLKDQELEELPCAHTFHAACVRPWLNEQRTCPNCRKVA